MADLYFKVSSDWQEVVRLREEITRLENQLNQFNGKAPLEVLNKLCDELVNAKSRLQALVDDAAIAGDKMQEAFKNGAKIDLSTPEGQLKAFDATAEKFCNNFISNLSDLQERVNGLTDALNASGAALANIRVTEQNAAEIDNLKKQNQELQAELTRQSEELQNQIRLVEQLKNTIAENNQATTNALASQKTKQESVTDAVDKTTESIHGQAEAAVNAQNAMTESATRTNAALDEELRKNESIKKSLEGKQSEIESLTEELQKYQSEFDKILHISPNYGKIRRLWRENQFRSAYENGEVDDATAQRVSQLYHLIDETKQKIAATEKETEKLSSDFAESSQKVEQLKSSVSSVVPAVNTLDEATKRITVENLKESLGAAERKAERLAGQMIELNGKKSNKETQLDKLKVGGGSAEEIKAMEDEVAKINTELENTKQQYNAATAEAKNLTAEIQNMSGHQVRMRTQIMNAREEMIQLIAAGKEGTPEFAEAAEQAGELRKQMSLANAYMQYFANPNRNLAGLKTTLQGVAGSMSLVTGVMGVFNDKSEEMAAIQTKIQSLIGVIVGLEQVYNVVKKTSTARIWLQEVATKALNAARGGEATTTAASTTAQVANNVARTAGIAAATGNATATTAEAGAIAAEATAAEAGTVANLTLAGAFRAVGAAIMSIPVFGWIVAGITAIIAVASHFISKAAEVRKEALETKKALEKSVAEPVVKFQQLRAEWNRVSGDGAKVSKFIREHANDFNTLGLNIKNAKAAEELFNEKTKAVIAALSARAKAAASAAKAAEYYGKMLELIAEGEQDSDEYSKLNSKYEYFLKMQQSFLAESESLYSQLGASAESSLSGVAERVIGELQNQVNEFKTGAQGSVDGLLNYVNERRNGRLVTTQHGTREEYQQYAQQKVGQAAWMFQQIYGHAPENNRSDRQAWNELVDKQNIQSEQDWRREHKSTTTELVKEARSVDELTASVSALQNAYAAANNDADRQRIGELLLQEQQDLERMNKARNPKDNSNNSGRTADEIMLAQIQANQEVSRRLQQNQLLQRQAEIDMMAESGEKEIAQMRLNHTKRLQELDAEEAELLQKKRESAGLDKNGKIRNGYYTGGQYMNVQLTQEERLGVDSERISENAAYAASVLQYLQNIEKGSESAFEKMNQMRAAYTGIVADIDAQIQGLQSKTNLQPYENAQLAALQKLRADMDAQYLTSQNTVYESLLQQYQNFEQRRVELKRKYDEDIAVIESQHPTDDAGLAAQKAALEERKRQYEAALQSINNEEYSTMQKSSQLLVDLFSNAADMSNKKIREVIANTQLLLTYISTAKDSNGNAQVKDSKGNVTKTITQQQIVDLGFTPESIQVLEQSPEKIKAIQDAIQRLQQQATKNNPFARLAEDIQSLFSKEDKDGKTKKSMKDLAKDAAACADVIGGLAGQLADMFNSIGDTETADAFSSVQDMMSTVSNIGKGFAEGGLVGGIAAAAGEAINYVGKALQANQRHKEALKKIMQEVEAEQRAYNMLILQQNLAYEEAATIFGTMSWEKAKRAVEVMKDAYAKLNAEIYGEGGHKQRTGLFTFEWINDAYQGLRDIEIKTGHEKTGLFGWGSGRDIYSSVLDVYPDLIDAEGKLNVKRAEAIIQTREMSQEDKDALQSMIDYANMAEEAWQQVHDYFTDIFGSFGDTLTDALVEGFENGTSAAKDFTDSVGDMLEKLAKQMVFSILFSELIENAQAAMEEVTKNDDLTDQQKFDQYAAIISDLTNNVIARESQADAMLQQFKDAAAKNGLSIFDNTSDQQADKKGFAAMSQDTGEELNGRFTALQIAGENLSAQMNAVAPVIVGIGNNTAEIKDMVDGIGNVADDMLTNIVECYTELNLIRVNTDDMYSIMKSNKTTLEKIEKNTKNI